MDTDHLSLIQRDGLPGQRIRVRLSSLPVDQVATTVISYEEQVKGRLLVLSQAKTAEKVTSAYRGLQQLSVDYQSIHLLAFDEVAFDKARQLRKQYPRLGAMDLKIPAIALTQDATVLTRNQKDFGQILNLKIEDWSQ